MEISRKEALKILDISDGSSSDDIRAAYKKQALKWHPDKHKNSPEATKKFQDISSAYERLTKPQENEIHLTMDEMFDLFAHVFFGSRGPGAAYPNGNAFFFEESDSDSDEYGYTYEPFREKPSRERDIPKSSRPTVSEAQKHEQELLEEEEKLKRQKEKRKERKKRRKAKKRQEKEVRYGGGDGKKKGKKEAVPESSSEEEEEEQEENKENLEVNSSYSETQPDLKAEQSSNGAKVLDSSQTNSNSHKQGNTSHRKEVHDVLQGADVGTGGDAPKAKTKSKKQANSVHVHNRNMTDSESDEETQGLDMNSAFFARAAGGKAKKQTSPPSGKTKKKAKGKKEESESLEDMDPQILESRKQAVKGNEMANIGNYTAAVKFFTKAIELNPMDFRFFGNRSFCFDHLQMYDHALEDAEKAISLDKTWPKGFYRKGRALTGLKLYSDAEAAFEHVLKLDKNCSEAIQELHTVRVYRLMEMGFSAARSEAAIQQYNTVQAALENLLSQGGLPENGEMEEVYISDEEDYITQTIQEGKLDSKNPENLRSLWIGNLQPTVSEKELKDLFKPYGEVTSMRRMADKFCAFVNYQEPRMASLAMDRLQGRELHGKLLLIKFPDNPIDTHIQAQGKNNQEFVDLRFKTMILRKNQGQTSTNKGKPPPQQQQQQQKKQQQQQQIPMSAVDQSKISGPVNGDECFFWRTTGCWYAERCHYKHQPESKGVDRK